jgi:predicted TIM-barrel fold metal-dependent hydrolase
MIVDLHVHLPWELQDSEDMEVLIPAVEDMLEAGKRAGIDKQVLLGLKYGEARTRTLRAIVERYPDQLAAFVFGSYLDPDSPAVVKKAVQEGGFVGIKLYEEQPHFPLSGLLAGHALYDMAAELGVPVLIHSWHTEEGLAEILPSLHTGHFPMLILEELGKRHPETTFIIAHAGGMWVKAFQYAQPYPNICFDVCGFDPERGIVEKAVEVLGAERVYYGSDAPGRNYAAQLAKVRYADISDRDKALILGGNAARLLGWR